MVSDEKESLETTGIEVPDLPKIVKELQQAQADSSTYTNHMAQVKAWWMCEWDNQSNDGRRYDNPFNKTDKAQPWNGCSDSRLRIVDTIVRNHVILSLAAFWTAKKQVKSIRPFHSGREANVAQQMMDWRLGMMKRELQFELNNALSWRFGGGLSFLKIEWEQKRELVYVPLSMDMISQLTSAVGLSDITSKILDPDKAYDKDLVTVLQSLSPILDTGEARKILNDLRMSGQSEFPISQLRVNKPKWSAKRPYYDLIFPSETCDIQSSRFTCERELVSEVELTDRIVTDGYDPDFVEEAIEHKGKFGGWWAHRAEIYQGSDRDLIELNHFLSFKLHNDIPCLYRTVFNQVVAGDDLYAVHRKFEYDHGQFPFVAMRRTNVFRPLLSSIGIAEESYTDELDIKYQQDGLNNHTQIVHKPPMIVPPIRAQATLGSYGPGAVMTALRPDAVVFAPLPPMDQVPVMVMQFVQQRLDRRYPITSNGDVSPEIVALWRQQLANEVLGEFELALEQTLKLMQQYETDADIQRVCGQSAQFHLSQQDILGEYETSAAVDINNVDIERAKEKLGMLAQMLPFKESGMVFSAMAQIIDPDLADALQADQASPVAMDKEKKDEYNAIGQILAGMDALKPMNAMNQLRLNTIQEILSDPETMTKFQTDKVAMKRLQNRTEFFQNQIQQYQQNPQIGRALSTQTFSSKAPALTMPGTQ